MNTTTWSGAGRSLREFAIHASDRLLTRQAVAVAAGGAVTDGAHYYRVAFVTATGETYVGAGTPTSPVATTGGGNNTVNLEQYPRE